MSSLQERVAVQAASDTVAFNYTLLASLVLVVYDGLLTLSEEVPYIWKKKWKLGTALYLLARYAASLYILTDILLFLINFTLLEVWTCTSISRVQYAFFIPNLIGIQGILLARAYAVTNYKRLVLAVLSVLGLCVVVPNVVGVVLNSCILTIDDVSSIAVILFDTTVVVVTLAGTLGTCKVCRRSTLNRLTLTHLLAEQSLLIFGFILTISVTNTTLSSILRNALVAIIGPIQNSLATIIICRFHLNLQRMNAHSNSNASRDLPTISIGSFRAASQRIHDAIMAEFGGSLVDESVEAEAAGDVINMTLDLDMSSGTTVDEIELEEAQHRRQSSGITEA